MSNWSTSHFLDFRIWACCWRLAGYSWRSWHWKPLPLPPTSVKVLKSLIISQARLFHHFPGPQLLWWLLYIMIYRRYILCDSDKNQNRSNWTLAPVICMAPFLVASSHGYNIALLWQKTPPQSAAMILAIVFRVDWQGTFILVSRFLYSWSQTTLPPPHQLTWSLAQSYGRNLLILQCHRVRKLLRPPVIYQSTSMHTCPKTSLIYHAQLVKALFPQAKECVDRLKMDGKDWEHSYWLAHVNPLCTRHSLPPIINSEEDARDWINRVLLLPAISIVCACRQQGIGFAPAPNCSSYIASAVGGNTIPDAVVIDRVRSKRISRLCIKMKTKNAMTAKTFSKLQNLDTSEGLVILFSWPTSDRRNKKQAKIIVQVNRPLNQPLTCTHHNLVQIYSQMHTHKISFRTLSSYESTIFLYLTKDKYLYMSKQYGLNNSPLVATVAWMLLALGKIGIEHLALPSLDKRHLDQFPKTGPKTSGLQVEYVLHHQSPLPWKAD